MTKAKLNVDPHTFGEAFSESIRGSMCRQQLSHLQSATWPEELHLKAPISQLLHKPLWPAPQNLDQSVKAWM